MAITYQIQLTKRAVKDLRKVKQGDPKLYSQLVDAIGALTQDPYPDGCVDLGGREGFRIRVRHHRILYSVEDDVLLVEVARVGPRGDVYK